MDAKFDFAKLLVYKAGQFIKSEMQNTFDVEEKSRFDDLVTSLDKKTQKLLIQEIIQHYPDDNILAEEDDVRSPIAQGNVWVLDPIDGTVNFIVQKDNFTVMLAYYEEGVGQFGIIYDVMADILYSGGGHFDVYANDKKIVPFQECPLERCLLGVNSAMYAENDCGIAHLASETLGVRIYGGAGISMAKVMQGKLLAYFSYIQPWDYAAAKIMGETLGFTLLTLDGEEPNYSTRQKVMFLPKSKLNLIQSYLTKK